MRNDCISIEKDGDIIRDEKVLVELFNENYINTVGNCEDRAQGEATVDKIISKYSAHPSIPKIKREVFQAKEFELAYANAKDINQIIKYLNVIKAEGPDGISSKFVNMLAHIIDCHIANIINKDIFENKYSENA